MMIHIIFSAAVLKNQSNTEQIWQDFSDKVITSELHLRKLSDALGYGGYIHYFKNAVLRDNQEFLVDIRESAREIESSIQHLRANHTDKTTQSALKVFEDTFIAYRNKEPLLTNRQAISPEKLDELVKVDDGDALQALKIIREQVENELVLEQQLLKKQLEIQNSNNLFFVILGLSYFAFGVFCVAVLIKKNHYYTRLTETKAKLEAVLENIPTAVMVVNESGRVDYVNSSTSQTFGGYPDQLVGMQIENFVPTHARTNHVNHREKFVANNGARAMDDRNDLSAQKLDGTEFPIQISLKRIERESGNITVVILKDITQEKELEKRRFQQQRLEAIGQLTAGIAHDFNNTLAIIAGNKDIAASPSIAEPLKQKALESIEKATNKASALTRKLLSFGKQQEQYVLTVNLTQLIEGMQGIIKTLMGGGVNIKLELDPNLWLVSVDKTSFESALINLLINAKHALSELGNITVKVQNYTHIREAAFGLEMQQQDYIKLSVIDDGCGMSKEMTYKIFDPFYTSKPGGSGMGLSMVYGFVNQSKGHIEVLSEKGQGTTFNLYFPRHIEQTDDKKTIQACSEEKTSLVFSNKVFLIVSDNKNTINKLKETLLAVGSNIITVPSKEAAFEVIYTRKVDILMCEAVFSDKSSGIEVVKKLCSVQPEMKAAYLASYGEENLDQLTTVELSNETMISPPYSLAVITDALINITA